MSSLCARWGGTLSVPSLLALTECCRSSSFPRCGEVAAVGDSPVSFLRQRGSCLLTWGCWTALSSRLLGSFSMTHSAVQGQHVSHFLSWLQRFPTGALQFEEVIRIAGKIQMPQSGYK